MRESGDIKRRPAIDGYGPLFLLIRRMTFLISGIIIVSLIGGVILLSFERTALQQKITERQQDISQCKNSYSIDTLEREWTRYAAEIYSAAYTVNARSAWGERLGILSQTIPQGLSLDYISLAALPSDETRKVMTLETIAVTKEKPGVELARSFMEQLKNEKEYGKEIKINYAEKIRINEKDLEEIQIMVKVPG